MKRTKRFVQCTGIGESIKKCLTTEWQTSRLIALQIIVQPDALARTAKSRSYQQDLVSVKVQMIAKCLTDCMRKGVVESRKVGRGLTEYRLKAQ